MRNLAQKYLKNEISGTVLDFFDVSKVNGLRKIFHSDLWVPTHCGKLLQEKNGASFGHALNLMNFKS